MKVLAVSGSKRKNGLNERLCRRVLDGASAEGHETELVNLYDYRLEYCRGCWVCAKTGRCAIKDDFETLFRKFETADAVILGSPCYWGDVTAVLRTFIERHTGYAIRLPESAQEFHKLPFFKKIRKMLEEGRKFGGKEYLRKKKFIFIITMTAPKPLAYLSGDLPQTIGSMKIYMKKMKGRLAGKIYYTDTLFKVLCKKEVIMMEKAYRTGKRL